MSQNEDLEAIRRAIRRSRTGGNPPLKASKPKIPPPRPERSPAVVPHSDSLGRSFATTLFGSLVGGAIILILILLAVYVAFPALDQATAQRRSGSAYSSGQSGAQDNPAPYGGGGSANGRGSAGGAGCVRASVSQLTVSPHSGSAATRITLRGTGYIPNGQVRLIFHANEMGTANTDCNGAFSVTLPIPNADFYSHFPGQQFSISTTEWRGGRYEGNGAGGSFRLTG